MMGKSGNRFCEPVPAGGGAAGGRRQRPLAAGCGTTRASGTITTGCRLMAERRPEHDAFVQAAAGQQYLPLAEERWRHLNVLIADAGHARVSHQQNAINERQQWRDLKLCHCDLAERA